MLDIIFIRKLSVKTIIGVYEQEKISKQLILIDLNLHYDTLQARESDNIKYALDYHQLSNDVIDFVAQSKYELIEALAEAVAVFILNNRQIKRIEITLSKPQALEKAEDVGIKIIRTNA